MILNTASSFYYCWYLIDEATAETSTTAPRAVRLPIPPAQESHPICLRTHHIRLRDRSIRQTRLLSRPPIAHLHLLRFHRHSLRSHRRKRITLHRDTVSTTKLS
eukprot:33569_2